MTSIPVNAAVPIDALADLIATVKRDWPLATQRGVTVAMKVEERGVAVTARVTAYDSSTSAELASVEFDGHWEISGGLRWTRRQ